MILLGEDCEPLLPWSSAAAAPQSEHAPAERQEQRPEEWLFRGGHEAEDVAMDGAT